MNNNLNRPGEKVLWSFSRGRCAICKTPVIENKKNLEDKYLIGEQAHIYGEKPGAARYDSKIPADFVKSHKNHILLCPTCHTKIDKNIDDYSCEMLFEIKKEHESTIEEDLRQNVTDVTFAELDIVAKYLLAQRITDDDLILISPIDKIKKNNLSIQVDRYIKMGLMQRNQIRDYLVKNPDIGFTERLRAGFIKKYNELKSSGMSGDDLFSEMFDFASNYSTEYKIRAAGLVVLTYFFEICDIFEK